MVDETQPNHIVDPADRVNDPLFVELLTARYRTRPPASPDGITVTEQQYLDAYSNFCDVACQLLWPDRFDLTFDDPFSHTSDHARAIANILMVAAGFGEHVPAPEGTAT